MVARKSPEQFKTEFNNLVGNEYTLLSEYEKSNLKVKVLHNLCNNIYEVTPNAFLRGGRCPNCFGNKGKLKNTDKFKEEVLNLVGDEYTVLGEYINRSTNIKIRHNTCKREYYVEPGNFLCGSRCIECYYESLRFNKQQVVDSIYQSLGAEYSLESGYTGMYTPIEIKHLKCNRVFKVRLNDVIWKHSGCPFCKESKGEKMITRYLKSNNIRYEYQRKFDGLRDLGSLSYDFYLPDSNTLIEYQGIQHYYPKTFGGISKRSAKENYKKQLKHDLMKSNYASNHNLKLLTPSYKLDNQDLINNYLKNNL